MFHHIGNVHRFMVDTSLRQRFIQESSGWSDKRVAAAVLLISWLLTHEHDSGPGWTLAKDRLGCLLPKIKSLAGGRSVPQARNCSGWRHESGRKSPACLSDFWTAQTRYCEYFSSSDCLQVRCNY
jgi:hypothetical protein